MPTENEYMETKVVLLEINFIWNVPKIKLSLIQKELSHIYFGKECGVSFCWGRDKT